MNQQTEYGGTCHFSSPKLCDAQGKEMNLTCSYGKPAESVIIGKESFMARCCECLYGNQGEI